MPLAGTLYNLDQWDGYADDWSRLFDQLRRSRPRMPRSSPVTSTPPGWPLPRLDGVDVACDRRHPGAVQI
jgi:hypothetical protein